MKLEPELGEAVYHCMTRTVNGEFLLDDVAKEVLRKQLWQTAEFCGVEILTYALMSNHFHVLVRVPQRAPLTDEEVLRRYRVLYPKPTKYQMARVEVLTEKLKDKDDAEGRAWRERQVVQMGDVSPFMKLLKQRFSVWFNRTHGRYGTLWAERFKSVLVEPTGRVIEAMAAYIDLNPVRAGLVEDPKDYRFSGYGEAVAGGAKAQAGIAAVSGVGWARALTDYRQTLFGWGADSREHAQCIQPEELRKVVKAKGRLPLATLLRCRVRYFTDGAVLGSKAFVGQHLRNAAGEDGGRSLRRSRGLRAIWRSSPLCGVYVARSSANGPGYGRLESGIGASSMTRRSYNGKGCNKIWQSVHMPISSVVGRSYVPAGSNPCRY